MRFSWSLKRALLLSFVAATVLPILILGVLTAKYFERKQLETHSLLINSHALSVSREALEFINNTKESLALVKQALHSGLLPGRSEIDQYLQLTVDSSASFEAIYLLDQDYRVTHLGLSRENNKPRVEYLGLDLSAYEVFSQQHDFNRPVWSDSYISSITAVSSLSLLIPLEQGFLLGTVSLQRVSDELAKRLLHVGGGYQFSLLDDLGVVIADTRPGLASQRFNMRFHPEVRDALDHQVEIPSKYHEDYSLLESVHLVPGTGWVAYVSLPIDEVKKSVVSLWNFMLGVLAFAALLGVAFSLWLSRRVMNPVLLLRDATGEVARGNYDQALRPVCYEELEDLSRSFRDMIAAVELREQSIRESETRFRTLFQANPDAMIITRMSDERILSVNDPCVEMFGYPLEELVGKTAMELGVWENRNGNDRYLGLIHHHGHVENYEAVLRTRAGRLLTGLVSAQTFVLNDEDCRLAVIRDISKMKESHLLLARSESRFRSLVSVMGEGLIILECDGEIIQCNRAAEKLLTLPAGQILGRNHEEIFRDAFCEDGTPYQPGQYPSSLTLQSGEPVVNQLLGVLRADGETAWLQVNTQTLEDDRAGKPLAVVVSFSDVSRLKRVENDLRESEKYMQTLSMQLQGVLEAITDHIMILDQRLRIVWRNWFKDDSSQGKEPLSKRIRCHELPGVRCSSPEKVGDAPCHDCPVKQSFATGQAEFQQRTLADGRSFSLRTFPVFDEVGDVVNVILIIQDISESLRQQEQATRTGQLAALGELAAGVAHEINNPINGVINYAQLILNKAAEDSRERDLSQRIIHESERIAAIVRELLYFAREESSEIHQIAVRDAVSEALVLLKNSLHKEGVELRIQLPETLPMIRSRSHQVQQLILNLVSNALYALKQKYPGPDPDKIIWIKGEARQKGHQAWVRLTVRDHGVGIPKDILPRVMNPFVTTKPSAEGTGLGLSISHEIAKKHGGTLGIESVQGEYTEAVVELPAVTSLMN